jgi:hypothetical protein
MGRRLNGQPRVELHQPDQALSCAIGTVGIKGIPTGAITSKLWEKWRIIATPVRMPVQGA